MGLPKGTPMDEDSRAQMRDRIYLQACAIFERQGIAGTTMRQIAAECGLGASTIYDYFGGKDDIVAEFFRREQTVIAAMVESVSCLEASEEAIIRLLSVTGRFWLENLALSRVVARELHALRKETIAMALRARALLLDVLVSLLKKHQSGPEPVRLRIDCEAGASVLLELYRNLFTREGADPEALAHLAWSLFLDGARSREL